MSVEGLVFPPQYEAARKWLLLHGIYGVVGGTMGVLYPEFMMGLLNPMLAYIEEYTNLPHFLTDTPEKHRILVHSLAFAIGIGAIYLVYAGPLWNKGGKALAEGSIWTRILYVVPAFAFCFLTPYGSSLLFATALIDVLSIVMLKRAIGASWGDLVRSQTTRVAVIKEGKHQGLKR